MSAALSVQAVRKSYGRLEVLRGVELQVPAGTVFGLVGSNGAGKTTLFSIVSGYLRPDAGEVRLFGQPVIPGQPPAWGRFGILPQDASFQERATVGQQLIMYGMLQGMTESEAARETRRVLESVQLMEVFDRRPGTLSHGMHKRIGIAQAFLGTPGLVILDEPTAGLDPNAARLIRGWIRSLSEACTVIVSSHNLAEIEDLCDEVAILHQGQIVQQHTVGGVVEGAASLLIRPERPPTEDDLAQLSALPFVLTATWSVDAGRITVHFDRGLAAPAVAAHKVIGLLIDRSVPFIEVQIGKSLEERFIEQTANDT